MVADLTIFGSGLSVTGGDFDGNGLGDIAVSGRDSASVTLLRPSQTYVFSDIANIPNGTTLGLASASRHIATSGIDKTFTGISFDSAGQDLAFLPATAVNGLTTVTTSMWFRTTRNTEQTLIKRCETERWAVCR